MDREWSSSEATDSGTDLLWRMSRQTTGDSMIPCNQADFSMTSGFTRKTLILKLCLDLGSSGWRVPQGSATGSKNTPSTCVRVVGMEFRGTEETTRCTPNHMREVEYGMHRNLSFSSRAVKYLFMPQNTSRLVRLNGLVKELRTAQC